MLDETPVASLQLAPQMEPDSQEFPRGFRIVLPADYRRALRDGGRVADQRVSLAVVPNGLPYARLGLVVGRRFGTAPRRNRFKRLLREAFRTQRPTLPTGFDLLCSPRGRGPATLAEAIESLVALARRAAEMK